MKDFELNKKYKSKILFISENVLHIASTILIFKCLEAGITFSSGGEKSQTSQYNLRKTLFLE